MNIQQLYTPCLLLDEEKLTNNINKMQAHIKTLGVNLRPHGKTAKNIDVLKRSIAGQSGAITVSTIKEAEYYFSHGVNDIVYAVGVTPNKLSRIEALIKQGANITLVLDSIAQAEQMALATNHNAFKIPVLIELDCDGHRSGVTLDNNLLIDIAKQIHQANGLALAGVLTHAGGSYDTKSVEEIKKIAQAERNMAVTAATLLKEYNYPCPIVSIGSTPTATYAEDLTGITEIRAGVYVFQDLVMAGLGVCSAEDVAISVLTTVIGHQKSKNWIICDAGWMALSRDRGTAKHKIDQGYGAVCDVNGNIIDDLIVSATNQEHGIITSRSNQPINWEQFPVGMQFRVLPNHACATAAMHNEYKVIESDKNITDTWQRVNGW